MFGSTILEVAIGIIFVYLLLSLICSAVNEIIESFLKNRATDLERGIRELFNQEGGGEMVEKFYNHPLINGLFQGKYKGQPDEKIKWKNFLWWRNLPAYIPARNFSTAVIDLVLNPDDSGATVRDDDNSPQAIALRNTPLSSSTDPATMKDLRSNIKKLGNTQFARAINTLAEQSGNDINKMRENLEAWFNGSMDRVSGAYKRRTQWILFVMGLIITILLNVNTVTVVKRLSTDTTMRNLVVAEAEGFAKRTDAAAIPNFEAHRKQLEVLNLPIGWGNDFKFLIPFIDDIDYSDYFMKHLLGWLLTAAAISLGAPFWFDMLNKFMVIRATVKPHEKSLEEGSEDRQPKAPTTPPTTPPASPNAPADATPLADTTLLGTAQPGATTSPPTEPGQTADTEPVAKGEVVFTGTEAPIDSESNLDGCDVPIGKITLDEELPPSEGGIK